MFEPWTRVVIVAVMVLAAGWLVVAIVPDGRRYIDVDTGPHISATACSLSAVVIVALAACALGLRCFERTALLLASLGVLAMVAYALLAAHPDETSDLLHVVLVVVACVMMIPLALTLPARIDS
jgi:hypothetical protein